MLTDKLINRLLNRIKEGTIEYDLWVDEGDTINLKFRAFLNEPDEPFLKTGIIVKIPLSAFFLIAEGCEYPKVKLSQEK